MKLLEIPYKIINRTGRKVFKILGRDNISLAKIRSRRDLQEIGTVYGGWVVPTSLLGSDSICYCVGCGEDITFDLGLIDQFGCDVFAFDPTPRAIKHVTETAGQNPKYHFFEIGLWDKEGTVRFYVPQNPEHVSHSILNLQKTEDYIEVKVKRLQHVMKDLGHEKIDMLKIDIEGAEYRVIQSILEDSIDIKIICVEYDECFHALDGDYKKRIRGSVNKLLTAGYSLVCAQGNGNYTFVKNC